MAAVNADYKFPSTQPVTISQLLAQTTAEVAAGAAAQTAYLNGWPEVANFGAYTISGGGSGFDNYQAQTWANNTSATLATGTEGTSG
jgi:hypothetical protein